MISKKWKFIKDSLIWTNFLGQIRKKHKCYFQLFWNSNHPWSPSITILSLIFYWIGKMLKQHHSRMIKVESASFDTVTLDMWHTHAYWTESTAVPTSECRELEVNMVILCNKMKKKTTKLKCYLNMFKRNFKCKWFVVVWVQSSLLYCSFLFLQAFCTLIEGQ
jgi:hypothetical protein